MSRVALIGLGEVGRVFAEDLRIELIDGEIVEMSPIGDDHVSGLNLLVDPVYSSARALSPSSAPGG